MKALHLRKHIKPNRFIVPLFSAAATILLAISIPDTGKPGMGIRIGVCTLLVGSIMLALHASESHVQRRHFAVSVLLVAAVLIIAGDIYPKLEWVRGIGQLVAMVPIIWAAYKVIRWIARQEIITMEPVVAGVLVYLLMALAFGSLYGAIADLSSQALFCSPNGDGSLSTHTYFSLTTITTTGYGDFTACIPVARSVAVSEMVFGQVYLVTIISLLAATWAASASVPLTMKWNLTGVAPAVPCLTRARPVLGLRRHVPAMK